MKTTAKTLKSPGKYSKLINSKYTVIITEKVTESVKGRDQLRPGP